VPVSCDTSRKWVLPSWDNFEIPKPFARVIISWGKPFFAGDIDEHSQIKNQTDNLAGLLNEIGKC